MNNTNAVNNKEDLLKEYYKFVLPLELKKQLEQDKSFLEEIYSNLSDEKKEEIQQNLNLKNKSEENGKKR